MNVVIISKNFYRRQNSHFIMLLKAAICIIQLIRLQEAVAIVQS